MRHLRWGVRLAIWLCAERQGKSQANLSNRIGVRHGRSQEDPGSVVPAQGRCEVAGALERQESGADTKASRQAETPLCRVFCRSERAGAGSAGCFARFG